MAEHRYPPIEDYALISDSHSSALVSIQGSIDWACLRRFDAPSTFGRILDWERGGHCSLRPVGSDPAGRRYRGETMVLETDHRTEDGLGRTIDLFALPDDAEPELVPRSHPRHQLIRIAEGVQGRTEWELVCRPRFEYGLVHPLATLRGERHAMLVGGPQALSLRASVPLEARDGEVIARFSLDEGERAWFSMTAHLASRAVDDELDDTPVEELLRLAESYWQRWVDLCTYSGPHRSDVVRSLLVLKALTNEPSGAIVAAATTSLPESIGGERNWDYRYCWIRDATFTLYTEFILGYTSEARDFITWLIRTTAGRAQDLQVLYGVGGQRLLPEAHLDHLEGYRGSGPVRTGNEAARQFQLDLYGEVLDTAYLWWKYGGEIEDHFWEFLHRCVELIDERWREPDTGIWEVRSGRKHFVYSKALCWVGVDRGIKLAEALDKDVPVEAWRELREEIRRDILANGYDEELGSFVRSYGSTDLDASTLLLPLIGFVDATDERMLGTVDLIQRELTRDGLVYRYRTEDGIQGDEGTFTICSFWLVDNLALQGRHDEAQELFDRLCSFSNDVGLYSEEIDPDTGRFLGNFPQAFTHLALINAAINIQQEPRSRRGDRPTADPDGEDPPASGEAPRADEDV